MSIFDRKKKRRDDVMRGLALLGPDEFGEQLRSGFVPLTENPEILTGCRKIADTISSMTIYLMENTKKGDVRIVNELSKKLDIYPNEWMTRKTFVDWLVMTMLLYGRGNAVVMPHTANGLLGDLEPIPAGRVTLQPVGAGYRIMIDGKAYDPGQVLHFVYNPDKSYPWKGAGLQVALKDLAESLAQANTTKRAFMNSKWKPSIIVKVDALTDEFSSKAGRKKLLNSYIESGEAGEPWIIPAEQFSVEQVRPLTLADLAINDAVTLDKKTVAAILGVPAFVLGVGEYKPDEWNAFVSNTIRPIAKGIEQELTRKLLISPKMYLRFNISSLYSYDLQTNASVYSELFVKGLATGNEVRDKIGMTPMDGLDQLVLLENYIPLDRIGDQKKLTPKEE